MSFSLSLKILQNTYGGELLNGDLEFSSLTTDSRQVSKGSLFVALKGERFDGHDFIAQALAQGCSGLVVNADAMDLSGLNKLCQQPVWRVDDTNLALGDMARLHRKDLSAHFFAITGSSGKTTVKGMLRSICEAAVGKTQVLATRGNLNNHLGVPLTLLEVAAKHRYAVIEMGASALGEINYLTHLARPHTAMINNVMPAHLEGFGSIDNIARAKGEIYEGLHDAGVAVINLDDHYAPQWLLQNGHRKVLGFSTRANKQAAVVARHMQKNNTNCYRFELLLEGGAMEVELKLMGQHNVNNALAAATMAYAAGIDTRFIKQGLEGFSAEPGRLQLIPLANGVSLIDDTYNANPGSVKAAVDVLSGVETKKILVLGDMAELGASGGAEHEKTGAYAKQQGVDYLLAMGCYAKDLNRGFGKKSGEAEDIEQLIEQLTPLLNETTTVLVKGSRSSKMEKIVNHLKTKGKNNAASAC